MKRVVNGVRYDTEADGVEEITTWHNGRNSGDFKAMRETLYRTEKGNWFIHGVGGPMTRYREQVGDGYGGGELIRPLTEDEVVEWCEQHDKVHVLEEHFADRIEEA